MATSSGGVERPNRENVLHADWLPRCDGSLLREPLLKSARRAKDTLLRSSKQRLPTPGARVVRDQGWLCIRCRCFRGCASDSISSLVHLQMHTPMARVSCDVCEKRQYSLQRTEQSQHLAGTGFRVKTTCIRGKECSLL